MRLQSEQRASAVPKKLFDYGLPVWEVFPAIFTISGKCNATIAKIRKLFQNELHSVEIKNCSTAGRSQIAFKLAKILEQPP
jgi:hypothetical protein